MNKIFLKSTLAAVMTMAFTTGSVLAADMSTSLDKAGQSIETAGKNIGDSVEKGADKLGQFADDSVITAKVKKAFTDDKMLSAIDISVVTEKGVVTLSGFVDSTEKQAKAVELAKKVEGVKSVNDKLNIKAAKEGTVKEFASDTKITTEAKAKLLEAKGISSTDISVETVDGTVQLTGVVKSSEQAAQVERIVKSVEGVKTVKNSLTVKP